MLSKKMAKALNDQVNAELYSSYMYLSMVAYFESIDLEGCALWMRGQVQEEMMHAMKLYDYIVERGGQVTLGAIDAPPKKWKSALDVFQATLKHEQLVTSLINTLMDLAIKEKDHAAQVFLQWFIAEQVEEEATAGGIVNKVKMAGESGLFMLDNELGKRVFTPPAK